jgi:hypothetical protein
MYLSLPIQVSNPLNKVCTEVKKIGTLGKFFAFRPPFKTFNEKWVDRMVTWPGIKEPPIEIIFFRPGQNKLRAIQNSACD